MSILKHKDLIRAWLDGAVVQTKHYGVETWMDCVSASEADSLHIYPSQEYRIKPKVKTTWLWVAEWSSGHVTHIRSENDPWSNSITEYYFKEPRAVYKIEESKQEVV